MGKLNINNITTEQVNPNTKNIDKLLSLDIAKLIAQEDLVINQAINATINEIGLAIDACAKVFQNGGRIVYIGAGTSGRLAVLDASEMLPTYGIKDRFIGIIAGGDYALRFPIENSEDNTTQVVVDLQQVKLSNKDILIGLSASGRTPYVVAGLTYANSINCPTISIATSKDTEISQVAKIAIEAVVGPEVITGSTRMKSGTAQKMVLNMISTGTMVRNGYVYNNLMINVQPTNEKLRARAVNIIKQITGRVDDQNIIDELKQTNFNLQPIIIAHILKLSLKEAQNKLETQSFNELVQAKK